MAFERFELMLPRNAFTPRDAARAGDVWRTCQDAAVWGSSRRGWSPKRFREEKFGFIVRRMVVVHHRELAFGDPVAVETWVSTFLRGMITNREIRLTVGGQPAVSATQEWVFVVVEGANVSPMRAPATITAAFGTHDGVGLEPLSPVVEPGADGTWRDFAFDAWHAWMDPLAHANHPLYVDWCDEALARIFSAAGLDPYAVAPVSEEVVFKSGVIAPERVTVRTACVGVDAAGDAVFVQRVLGGDGRLCASATLRRRVVGGDGAALVAAFRADVPGRESTRVD